MVRVRSSGGASVTRPPGTQTEARRDAVEFSSNIAALKPSATLALAARARRLRAEGVPVVDLSAGEPAYPTPAYAAEAGVESIRADKTGYPPTQGIPELRAAIAGYLRDTTSAGTLDPGRVLVSAGVKQALFNCCYSLFGPGDEVLVLAPYWPSYPAIVELAGARPVIVDTSWRDGFTPDPDRLEAARTERTRGLLVNSPGNPTGAVYGRDTLAALARWCDERGIWLFSDEIYRPLAYGAPAPSILDVPHAPERTVLLDGVSKTFCMPGWRIGFAVGPAELIRKATDLQSQTTSGAVAPSQYAAAAALGNAAARDAWVKEFRDLLEGLRGAGMAILGEIGRLEVPQPPGAIYFYARLRDDERRGSLETAEALLQDAAVACIPGEPFGSPGFLRFNFAVERDDLEEGLTRVRSFFEG